MEAVLIAILLLVGLGLVAGIGLGVANHFMAVKENETAQKIKAELPGANCGACGFSGCAGYADALAESPNVRTNLCVPGGSAVAAKIAEILGTEAMETVPTCARVRCRGSRDVTDTVAEYRGIRSCKAASLVYSGADACPYGCIGFGDCLAVCDEGAISIRMGVAVIDEDKCLGCGKCVAVCPKQIIAITPKDAPTVLCRNPEKGAATKAVCRAGCMGCRLCERACPEGAVIMENGVARIDANKCVGCGKCVGACKFGVILMKAVSEKTL